MANLDDWTAIASRNDGRHRISIPTARLLIHQNRGAPRGTWRYGGCGETQPPFPITLPFDIHNHPSGTALPTGAIAAMRRAITASLNETDVVATRQLLDRTIDYITGDDPFDWPIDVTWWDLARAAGGGTNLAAMVFLAGVSTTFVIRDDTTFKFIRTLATGTPIAVWLQWKRESILLNESAFMLDALYPDTIANAMIGRRLGEIVAGLPEPIAALRVRSVENLHSTTLTLDVKTKMIDVRDLRAEDCLPII